MKNIYIQDKKIFLHISKNELLLCFNSSTYVQIKFDHITYSDGEKLIKQINDLMLENTLWLYNSLDQIKYLKSFQIQFKYKQLEDLYYYGMCEGWKMQEIEKLFQEPKKFCEYFYSIKTMNKNKSYELMKKVIPFYMYMKKKGIRIQQFDDKKYQLLEKNIQDGIYYPRYKLIAAAGSRSGNSLQNFPTKFRKYLIARKNHMIVQFDYNAAEAHMLAFLSNDQVMLDIFNKQQDIHKITASFILRKDISQITQLERELAKTIFFSFINSISLNAMAKILDMDFKDVRLLLNRMKKQYRSAVQWIQYKQMLGEKNKMADSLFGRKRNLELEFARDRKKALKQASNFSMQAPITDFKFKAIHNISQYNYKFLLSEIQDNIILEIPNNLIENSINDIKKMIEKPFQSLNLTIPVSIKIGDTFEGGEYNVT